MLGRDLHCGHCTSVYGALRRSVSYASSRQRARDAAHGLTTVLSSTVSVLALRVSAFA
jgi:hypothetical protein